MRSRLRTRRALSAVTWTGAKRYHFVGSSVMIELSDDGEELMNDEQLRERNIILFHLRAEASLR